MSGFLSQGVRFGLVGGVATLTHFVIAFVLLHLGIPVIWANAWGFAVAFHVSFNGHRYFTFDHRVLPAATSRRRFAVTALVGFALSEAFLMLTPRPEGVALAAAIATAALVTFLMSRYWAFSIPQ